VFWQKFSELASIFGADNVCRWHKADMRASLTNVRFSGANPTLTNRCLLISIYEYMP
jgi:hypothetical protein